MNFTLLFVLSVLFIPLVCSQPSPIYGTIDEADYLIGKFDPSAHPEIFTPISSIPTNYPMYFRRDALNNFEALYHDMLKDNPELPKNLPIVSATRNLTSQKNIWEGKWNGSYKNITNPVLRGLAILEYSSMPGTSRHHWGTDLCVNYEMSHIQ